MITFVCCHNNKTVLDEMLMPSLRLLDSAGFNYRTHLIDTTQVKYASAAEAYNSEVKYIPYIENDILVFLHQDIAFDNAEPWLRIEQELKNNPDQIIGFAGMSKQLKKTVSNLRDQGTSEYLTQTQINEKTEVESIDECCFAITREIFDKLRFDEVICDHWHLYAVNLCYQARSEYGIKSIVIPEKIFHKKTTEKQVFGGNMYSDSNFLRGIRKMAKKYRNSQDYIYTPCYICPTSPLSMHIKLLRTQIKNLFR